MTTADKKARTGRALRSVVSSEIREDCNKFIPEGHELPTHVSTLFPVLFHHQKHPPRNWVTARADKEARAGRALRSVVGSEIRKGCNKFNREGHELPTHFSTLLCTQGVASDMDRSLFASYDSMGPVERAVFLQTLAIGTVVHVSFNAIGSIAALAGTLTRSYCGEDGKTGITTNIPMVARVLMLTVLQTMSVITPNVLILLVPPGLLLARHRVKLGIHI